MPRSCAPVPVVHLQSVTQRRPLVDSAGALHPIDFAAGERCVFRPPLPKISAEFLQEWLTREIWLSLKSR